MSDPTARLFAAIKAVDAAVTGLSIGTRGSSPTVQVVPATEQAACQATINAFDWSAAAQTAWDTANASTVLTTQRQQIFGCMAGGILEPIGLYPANLVAVTAMVSGTSHFIYVGKAPYALTLLKFLCNVVTLGVTITWAEVAVFKGPIVPLSNPSLTRVGFGDVSAVFNTTGRKQGNITVAGVNPGDDLWLAYGSQATTPFQLRGMLADDLQSGVFCTAAVRPSLAAAPQVVTLASGVLVPAWCCGKV